jgi:hypothetical protein
MAQVRDKGLIDGVSSAETLCKKFLTAVADVDVIVGARL